MDLSGTIAPAGFSDWVYDPTRDRIYITTSDGFVRGWSVAQQTFVSEQILSYPGTQHPGSLDISADGRLLLVGETQQTVDGQHHYNFITLVDLVGGGVQTYAFSTGSDERGIADIAMAANDRWLVSNYSAGSGVTPLLEVRSIAPNALASPTIANYSASSTMASSLIASEDRRYILIEEENRSDGPLHIYDSRAGAITANASLYDIGVFGEQSGYGDISTAAGRVVDVLYNYVFVFDLNLKLVANLSSYTTLGGVVGAEFTDDGRLLFLWEGAQHRVLVVDAQTWQLAGSFNVASITGAGHIGAPYGAMDVVSNGRVLVLDTGSGLELVDLTAKLHTTITGNASSQTLFGSVGDDTVSGGAGDDTIDGSAGGANQLRGDEGADSITGGAGFDDINGNVGADTAHGGLGDDWVVGGKDNDILFGDEGADIVYGNIGDDTCDGGAGNDQVRGGQDNDIITGGAGNDWLSGDRGSDTITGGTGADIFHFFNDAGIDRVTDFNAAEGDRVQLDPGTIYGVAQVGADTVIDTAAGAEMVLVGVQMSTLPAGWIFGA